MKPCCLLWTNSDIRVILIKKTMISLVYTVCKSSMQWKTKQIQSFIKEWFINKATWATTRLGGLLPPPSPPTVLYPFAVAFVPAASSEVMCWEGLWLCSHSMLLSWGLVPIHEATVCYDASVWSLYHPGPSLLVLPLIQRPSQWIQGTIKMKRKIQPAQ